MKVKINLGNEQSVKLAFSYPNKPGSKQNLAQTILHWSEQMLERDGLAAKGANAKVIVIEKEEEIDLKTETKIAGDLAVYNEEQIILNETQVYLELEGDNNLQADFAIYAERLPRLLAIGLKALNDVFPTLRDEGKWDPENTGKWRFFLPLGLPMVKQKSLQFFHYPPIRLLDPMQDYLEDPVPVRWEELLMANGIKTQAQTRLYETVIDATPIAAPDDQGSKYIPEPNDFKHGLIPIEYFTEYQKSLVELLLNDSDSESEFTIPIVIYGSHPRQEFEAVFLPKLEEGEKPRLGVNKTVIANIIPGKKTAVLAANHPYRFYAAGQISKTNPKEYFVGCGKLVPDDQRSPKDATPESIMKADLASARWQILMAEDPSLDPKKLIDSCIDYWDEEAQSDQINNLIAHQGSLYYPDPKSESLEFEFKVKL